MAHHHNHPDPCSHVLKMCKKCEVPYCEKCGKEWAEPCTRAHDSYYWYRTPAYGAPYWYNNAIGTGTVLTTGGTANINGIAVSNYTVASHRHES